MPENAQPRTLAAETRALEAQVAEMIDLTCTRPSDLLPQVQACLKIIGRDVTVDIDSGHMGFGMGARFTTGERDVPKTLFDAFYKLTPPLLRLEVTGWTADRHCSGRIMFDQKGEVFLDLEDMDEDWDYQRSVDIEDLVEEEFDAPEDDKDPLLVPDL